MEVNYCHIIVKGHTAYLSIEKEEEVKLYFGSW